MHWASTVMFTVCAIPACNGLCLVLPSRAAYVSELFTRFGCKNWFLFAVIIHICTQFVGMAVQEDVLRIKKSLEKMIQNKSVVNGC